MDETRRTDEALFKYALLGSILCENLKRGELKARLQELAEKTYYDPSGRARRIQWRTLETWYYELRGKGFESLKRKRRKDRGTCRRLSPELMELVLALKTEDPGRSAPMLRRQLELAGRIPQDQVSDSTIQRLLRTWGLSGPRMEVERKERFRFTVAEVNGLWQGDALHGPKLPNPRSGQVETVKIFALLDDRSRLIVNIEGGFRETEEAFLKVLHGAVARRGLPRRLYLDNGSSFVGRDLRVVCAHLGVHVVHSQPYESASRGKIERFWRTLRAHVLDRLDPNAVQTLDELNVRLMAWVEGEYNPRPHEGVKGRSPREVWEEGLEQVHWVEDHSRLAEHFSAETVRRASNDATVSLDGVLYEVPGSFRRQKVRLRYSCLDSQRVWLLDGVTEIALKPIDVEANATRRRRRRAASVASPSRTGLNPVEQILARVSGRSSGSRGGGRS